MLTNTRYSVKYSVFYTDVEEGGCRQYTKKPFNSKVPDSEMKLINSCCLSENFDIFKSSTKSHYRLNANNRSVQARQKQDASTVSHPTNVNQRFTSIFENL